MKNNILNKTKEQRKKIAWKEYLKIKYTALEEYEKIRNTASEEWTEKNREKFVVRLNEKDKRK